jgi:6-phosphogluconolactonase (cycloisomerase 2 family)
MATTNKLLQAAAGVSTGSGSSGGGGGSGSSTLDISGASYASKSFSVATQAAFPTGVDFNPAGTKMIISDFTTADFFTYSLSTAWDVTTASYDGSSSNYALASAQGSLLGFCFGDNGTKLYNLDHNNAKYHQHTLTTAYDVSTASADSKSLHHFSTNETPRGIAFNSDGTKCYIASQKYALYGDKPGIFEWDLSTAWDISTASYNNKVLELTNSANYTASGSNRTYGFSQIHFNSSGTQVFLQDTIATDIKQYDLTTAWDISSGSYANKNFDLSNEMGFPRGLAFDPDATKMYTVGQTNDTVYQYDTNGTWTLSSGGSSTFVQDFFSVTSYTGNASTQTITNDVDLSSGGMVWSKRNDQNLNHYFTDTERGGTNYYDFMAGGEETGGSISSFNSDGYSLQASGNGNASSVDYTSYSFKDQDHFFKQFEYTGNGSTQQIAHGLGCVPGFLLIKMSGGHWIYWHNEFLGTSKWGYGNLNTAPGTSVNYFGNNTAQVDPTSTHFTVGNSGSVNDNGTTYTVYAFGHNSSGSGGFGTSGNDDAIKCGGYIGNGTTGAGPTIDLGFVPQFFLIRCADYATGWFLFDSERGMTSAAATNDPYFEVKAIAQNTGSDIVKLTASGVQITGNGHPNWNQNNVNYIYMAIRKPMTIASAGADIEDLFSTDPYTSNGSSKVITNGIDLDGEGGLVWIKARTYAYSSVLFDTNRGFGNYLLSDQTLQQNFAGNLGWTTGTFNNNGFTLPSDTNGSINGSYNYVSWTFRDAPKFFDSVTYNSSSGNVTNFGSAGAKVDHSLGSVPGLIIVKCIDTASTSWKVYHRGLNGGTNPEQYEISLNSNGAQTNSASSWYDTAPTSTQFTLGSSGDVNNSSRSYTAYLFAHNDNGDGGFGAGGDQDIIKCGSYTGNGSSTGPEIDLGFEAQWVLIKCATTGGSNYGWYIMDVMRGMNGVADTWIDVSSNAVESSASYGYVKPEPTGFKVQNADARVNASGQTYIYVAIRRGPLAAPTDATDVFDIALNEGAVDSNFGMDAGFPVDAWLYGQQSGTGKFFLFDRLIGNKFLKPNAQTAETTYSVSFDSNTNVHLTNDGTSSNGYIQYALKRAPGFFDAVAFTGNATAGRTVSHNLGVAPEMMWIKQRDNARSWAVYTSATGTGKFLKLEGTDAVITQSGVFDTAPTNSVFTVETNTYVNISGGKYIAYLFATLAGVSKVGSVTHSGTTNVDCGFSAGSRFVMLKRTDAAGDWYVWDSERGIVSGNDPYLLLNSTANEVTNTDYIDPLSSGFTITSSFTAGTYIFYAIA